MKLDFKLAEAYRGTRVELDGVINALGGTYPPPNPKTVVTYQNGDVIEYLIEGELGRDSIPDKANAVKIEIGTTVTSIGQYAFQSCSGLTSAMIPNSVTSIGNYAFSVCSGLTSVTIPYSVTSIGIGAFSSCSELTSVTIPDSVTNVGNHTFAGCSGLTSVTIPDSVTSIGSSVFSYCSELTAIVVDENNSVFDSRGGCNAIIRTADNTLLAGCKNTLIPDSVTSVGTSAFEGCSGLVSITIPDSVRTIEAGAFEACSDLTSVTIPDSVTSIRNNIFQKCSKLAIIMVDPNNSTYDSRNGCNAIIQTASNILLTGCKMTTIPDGVTKIGDYAFQGCSGLLSITIPNSVTSIRDWVFNGCSELTSITIGNSVKEINYGVFYGCSNLSSITSLRTKAPMTESNTFGQYANSTYTGRNTYSTGDNVLKVPQGATGYTSSYSDWFDPLQNASKCGFHIEYI